MIECANGYCLDDNNICQPFGPLFLGKDKTTSKCLTGDVGSFDISECVNGFCK